jgi:hypothetical protein
MSYKIYLQLQICFYPVEVFILYFIIMFDQATDKEAGSTPFQEESNN